MKNKILLSVATICTLSSFAVAQDNKKSTESNPTTEIKENYESYNYIGFGVETLTYKEMGTLSNGKSFKSSVTVNSPVYTSGSLIKANDKFDFTIDAASTLAPSQGDEKWQYGEYLAQKNKFDAVMSELKILIHYKITDNHRFVFGPSYDMFTMKRHTYINPADGTEKLQDGNSISLNEERISTLFGTAGYWYESKPFSSDGMRIRANLGYAKPLHRTAANTSTEEVIFNSTTGYKVDAGAYLGFEVTKGLEVGFFGNYSFVKKTGGDTTTVDSTTITWPENDLETFRYGINFVWNFSKK